jgi:hypothetical protein
MQLDWPLEPAAAPTAAHEAAKKKSGHRAALPDAPNLDFKP